MQQTGEASFGLREKGTEVAFLRPRRLWHGVRRRLLLPLLRKGLRVGLGLRGPAVLNPSRRSPARRALIAIFRPVYRALAAAAIPQGIVQVRYRGIPLFIDTTDAEGRYYLVAENINDAEASLCEAYLRPGDIAIDAGASYGTLTMTMARSVGPSGRVYAFEPAPHPRALLLKAVSCNNFTQVQVVPCALSDRAGVAQFQFLPRRSGSSFLSFADAPGADDEEREIIRVRITTLDQFFKGSFPRIRLIKLDVEGAEPLVLRGSRGLLQASPELVLITEVCPENLSRFGVGVSEYLEMIQSFGFQIYSIPYQRGEPPVRSGVSQITALVEKYNLVNLLCIRSEKDRPEHLDPLASNPRSGGIELLSIESGTSGS